MLPKDKNAIEYALKVNNTTCLLNTVKILAEYYSVTLIFNTLLLLGVNNWYAKILVKNI